MFKSEFAQIYIADSGAANAYVTNFSPALTAHMIGVPLRFLASNANTGASTVNVNSLGAVAIKRKDGSALQSGDIPAGSMCTVIYDGTYYQLESINTATLNNYTNSLSADVTMTNANTVYDGPSVAQGSEGDWFVSGYLTFMTYGVNQVNVKLWDGTTVIASGITQPYWPNGSGNYSTISLSGIISSPSGNIRISAEKSSG